MWAKTVVGCLLVVVILGAVDAFDKVKAKERVTEYRIQSQNLHAENVEKRLDQLEKEFDALSAPPSQVDITHTKFRVKKLEGSTCPKGEVSCGGDMPECVNNLFVCDGIKDCENGKDEDAKVCDGNVVRVGSTFRGFAHWTSCVQRPDHYWSVTITATKRSPIFTSRTFVRAVVMREADGSNENISYNARGYFVYGTRQLVVALDQGQNVPVFGVVCTFNTGDNDNADCEIKMVASLNQCGRVRVQRV